LCTNACKIKGKLLSECTVQREKIRLHTDPPLCLKHAAATKLALTVLFDGELGNVHCFHPDFIDRIKNVGLKLEFNVKVGENLRPAAIAELDWQADPNCFLIQNILDTYAAQVKATQDKVCCIIAVLIVFPLLTMLQPLIMPPSNIVVGSKHLS
jgi:hypothetical protein